MAYFLYEKDEEAKESKEEGRTEKRKREDAKNARHDERMNEIKRAVGDERAFRDNQREHMANMQCTFECVGGRFALFQSTLIIIKLKYNVFVCTAISIYCLFTENFASYRVPSCSTAYYINVSCYCICTCFTSLNNSNNTLFYTITQ